MKIRSSELPESRRTEVVNTLAALVGMDPADINVAIDSNPGSRYDTVRVAQDVEPEVAGFIAESTAQLPGVEVAVETRRNYELGPLVSQVLGYTGPISGEELADLKDDGYQPDDLLGRAGVEATYESMPSAASTGSRRCSAMPPAGRSRCCGPIDRRSPAAPFASRSTSKPRRMPRRPCAGACGRPE